MTPHKSDREESTLSKALSLLTPREKRSGMVVLALLVLKGFADMIGVVSIMPFLSLVGNPEFGRTNPVAAAFFSALGIESLDAMIVVAGVVVIVIMVLSAGLRAVAGYAVNRWVAMREYGLSLRLLETYLRQPYAFFLNRHSGDMSSFILSETGRVISDAYRPAADFLSSGITLVFIGGLLLWNEPVVTLASTAVIGGYFAALFGFVRPMIVRLGDARVRDSKARYRAAGEAIGGIKQIKLLGRESEYLSAYSGPALSLSKATATMNTLRQVPRFILESVAFSGIVILTIVLVRRSGGVGSASFAETLPVLGLLAFAGLRILPSMQIMYSSIATIRYGAAAVDALHADLSERESLARLPTEAACRLPLVETVEFKGVTFSYPGGKAAGVRGIDLRIPAGHAVGIVGSTGAGKTTLTDLLLGLLEPSSGDILVDDVTLEPDNLRAWQANLGYVPQEIFLTDQSIARNIALGVPPARIDRQRVEDVARMARIHEFVVKELPDGYDTEIGERGVRLSGGQRQRIGIARALYGDPQVIVFDEATSALDNATEREVMAEIAAFSGDKTVIMIAHRLSTVRECDMIVVLDSGRVVGTGTYDELSRDNVHFARMARFAGPS